jgi:hypothetical protein
MNSRILPWMIWALALGAPAVQAQMKDIERYRAAFDLMRDKSGARIRVIGLFLVWAVMFAASYAVPMSMEATGDGFTRGLNRLGYWFWPQVAAFVLRKWDFSEEIVVPIEHQFQPARAPSQQAPEPGGLARSPGQEARPIQALGLLQGLLKIQVALLKRPHGQAGFGSLAGGKQDACNSSHERHRHSGAGQIQAA